MTKATRRYWFAAPRESALWMVPVTLEGWAVLCACLVALVGGPELARLWLGEGWMWQAGIAAAAVIAAYQGISRAMRDPQNDAQAYWRGDVRRLRRDEMN